MSNRLFSWAFNFKYLKLSLFALSVLLTYVYFVFFNGGAIFRGLAIGSGAIAAFFGGIFYAFGFTGPVAAGIFISLDSANNFWLFAFLGGIGAVLSDYFIFKFVRLSFKKEFDSLKKTYLFKRWSKRINSGLSLIARKYLLLALAGFFIASPLPDELGVALLAGFTDIEEKTLILLSFILNTLGIIVLLSL